MEGQEKKYFGSLVEEDQTKTPDSVELEMIVLGDSSNSSGTEIVLDTLDNHLYDLKDVKQETQVVETKSEGPMAASEPYNPPIINEAPSQELKTERETGQPANHQYIRMMPGSSDVQQLVIDPSLLRFSTAAGLQAVVEPHGGVAKRETHEVPASGVDLQQTLTIIGIAFENFRKEMVAQFSGQMPHDERQVNAGQPEVQQRVKEETELMRTSRIDGEPVVAASSSSKESTTTRRTGSCEISVTDNAKRVNKSTCQPSEQQLSSTDSLTTDTDDSLFTPSTSKRPKQEPITTSSSSKKRKEIAERKDCVCACRHGEKNLELTRQSKKVKDSLYRGLVKEMVKSVVDPSRPLDWPEEGGIKELAGQYEAYFLGRMDLKPRLKSITTQRFFSYYRNSSEDKLRLNYQPFFECLCEFYCPHKPGKLLKGWIDLVEIIHLKPREIFMDYWRSMYMFCNKSCQNVMESVRLYDDVCENLDVAPTLDEICGDLPKIRQEILKRLGRREEVRDARKPRKPRKPVQRWEPDD